MSYIHPIPTGQVYFYHIDHLGTPKAMTDSTATVVWRAEYAPFGGATVNDDTDGDGNAVENNVRFPGQYYDSETGLHYNGFRTYDPATGRYITADPTGLDGGINLYAYSFNNPIKYFDPDGLLPVMPWPFQPLYGNWCGPGDNDGEPIDCFDIACQTHDFCYESCGLNAYTRWLHPGNSCARKCDEDFQKDWGSCKGCDKQ